jgi:hypothetical protein
VVIEYGKKNKYHTIVTDPKSKQKNCRNRQIIKHCNKVARLNQFYETNHLGEMTWSCNRSVARAKLSEPAMP